MNDCHAFINDYHAFINDYHAFRDDQRGPPAAAACMLGYAVTFLCEPVGDHARVIKFMTSALLGAILPTDGHTRSMYS